MVATPEGTRRYTDDDFLDIEHTGPSTFAGKFMRRFWHPIYRTEDLPPGRAKPVRILNEDFTLYRGESGEVHAVAFRCAHRGTQLSTGWVEGDNLRCFYHGWAYDGNGQCVEQPAEPEPFCNRIRIKSYPVENYLGMVFAYLGDGAPPPLPRFAVAEAATLSTVETSIWPYNYWTSLDNKQDYAHQPFVHQKGGPATRGKSNFSGFDLSSLPSVRFEETDWGWTGWRSYPSGIMRIEHIIMPNLFLHKDRPGQPRSWDPPNGWDDTWRWTVPIDDEHHLEVSLEVANAQPAEIDEYHRRHQAALAGTEPVPFMDLVQAVLDGRMTVQELGEYDMHGQSGSLQDAVARMGQGAIPDRRLDHLGQTDAAPSLFRQLFMREMRALAEEQPMKQWTWPADLHAVWERTQ